MSKMALEDSPIFDWNAPTISFFRVYCPSLGFSGLALLNETFDLAGSGSIRVENSQLIE